MKKDSTIAPLHSYQHEHLNISKITTNTKIEINTDRTTLTILNADSAELILKYYLNNKSHLDAWEPIREESYYTLEHWQTTLANPSAKDYRFAILSKATHKVICVCNFSNVVQG